MYDLLGFIVSAVFVVVFVFALLSTFISMF